MAELRFTILGCGSSGGVPRIGGIWGECDPMNPKNTRRRCSMRTTKLQSWLLTLDVTPQCAIRDACIVSVSNGCMNV